jgi:uncharacterized Zn finger protein
MSRYYGGFAPYVSVAKRKIKAAKEAAKLKKQGKTVQPVIIEGRTIAHTFWGKAWCEHLESYSDYENRLPRGRTYVRNGSVIDLNVEKGIINALVSGSAIYKIKITIAPVITSIWTRIVRECAGKIGSLIELLQGKFSKSVMEIIANPEKGLFPKPKEIKLNCSCPDGAYMCKHVAAVLYGVGARLDERPEDLFLLRQTDHLELLAKAGTTSLVNTATDQSAPAMLAESDLSSLFGIDMGESLVKKPVKKPAKKKISAKPKKVALKVAIKPKIKSKAKPIVKPKIATKTKWSAGKNKYG